MGEIDVITVGDGPRRHDPHVGRDHHHLLCSTCGELRNVHPEGADALWLPESQRDGFTVERIDVVFVGRCRRCRTDWPARAGPVTVPHTGVVRRGIPCSFPPSRAAIPIPRAGRRVVQVLVVSQNPAERRRATSALDFAGDVEVVEADGPGTARELMRERNFDVLVIDGDLEPMGGFSLLYELRADAEFAGESSPPAIVLTSRDEDRWLAAWAGSNRTLDKPVDPFRLAREVAESLGREPGERRVREATQEVEGIVDDRGGTAGLTPDP